jgi:DNA polymerase I-like protein with 3'-5' exonuclease and polymerase domains
MLCAGVPQVSPEERERAKRVVYGIVYGQTPWGLAQQLADQSISTAAAQGMIDSFLARFQGRSQRMIILLHLACLASS